ncbi:hypothetical protein FIV42_21455 [Persicimonas caeni]|uniref:Tetratricopeptide repeat protein n=1 Tax=Persicimonas caeni TaxID=2292766 RepID=A0A4Y6PYH9_PERCE|nr:hypothetical protein [Persicimonas caeni]QDG53219.1 hypothetical protein FIV42_21455 [Persicimonas caeni]QED34441.1 hypothetical protein FRD00_21450 [Persicimonas caeni]
MADQVDQKTNGVSTLSDTFLETTRKLVERSIDEDTIEEDREAFFEALFLLQSGDVDGAIDGFRSAARKAGAPFDALSIVALAECQRIRGREAAAIREWKKIASDDDAPHAARYVAWLSLASLAERRQDQRLLQKANDALEEFPEH